MTKDEFEAASELYKPSTIKSTRLLGTQFEASDTGWCKHCGWASFAHFVVPREDSVQLLCMKHVEPTVSATGDV